MFVIENKSKSPISIEFVYDTLDLEGLILNDILTKITYANSSFNITPYLREELKDSIYNKVDGHYIFNYLMDSLPISSLIPKSLGIGNLLDEEYMRNQFDYQPDFFPTLSKWNSDSSFLKDKILNQNSVIINLEPNLALFEFCETCADCTCMIPEFPVYSYPPGSDFDHRTNGTKLMKIKIMINESDYLELTPNNFLRIMKMEEVRGHENSAILRIE